MRSVNKVILIGHVGQDPEFKSMPSGDGFVSMSLATTDRWRDKNSGEQKERTEWHRLTCWGRQAEIARDYITKGTLLYVEGSLRNNKWQDKEGNERMRTEITTQLFNILSPKQSGNDTPEQSQQPPAPQSGPAELDDDLPF